MKNKFSIYFILVLPLLSVAQINTGEIHYQVSIDIEKNIKEIEAMSVSPGVKAKLLESYRNAKPVQLILKFQTDIAFSEGELDLNDYKNTSTILIQSGAKKQTYTIQNPHSILTTGGLMGDILVKEPTPVWELEDKTREIGGYTCYKAKGYLLVERSTGKIKRILSLGTPQRSL